MNIQIQEVIGSYCPYCGEKIQLLIDCSIPLQEYIEDCQVCCAPMQIRASIDEDGIPDLEIQSETD